MNRTSRSLPGFWKNGRWNPNNQTQEWNCVFFRYYILKVDRDCGQGLREPIPNFWGRLSPGWEKGEYNCGGQKFSLNLSIICMFLWRESMGWPKWYSVACSRSLVIWIWFLNQTKVEEDKWLHKAVPWPPPVHLGKGAHMRITKTSI